MRSILKSTEQLPECPAWLAASAERCAHFAAREGAYYDDPGPEIHRRVKRLREADPELRYGEAMHRVFNNDPQLKEVYAALPSEPDDRVEAGREVDRRARACMEDSGCDYSAAFHAVLGADPELKRRYAQV